MTITSIRHKREGGFTLVELAIVMIIIGLLLGGVLKGQEMIANARVTSTIAQMKAIQTAFTSFQDTYNAVPGDMGNARTRIPNCTAANFCLDAPAATRNDGRVTAAANDNPAFNANLSGQQETVQAWKQLALANLISGINTTINPQPAVQAFGVTHPTAPIGGGFHIYFDSNMVDATIAGNTIAGHFIRLDNSANGVSGVAGNAAMTPTRAAQIDVKMDDGDPNRGDVFGDGAGAGAAVCKVSTATGDYNGAVDANNCDIYFRIDG